MERAQVDRHWNPETQPHEINPSWQHRWPPALEQIRRGVTYLGIRPGIAHVLVSEAARRKSDSRPIHALGAIGPHLFIGKEGRGRWIPFDPDATDEIRDRPVRERDWPYCWGDVVWVLLVWQGQPAYFRMELEGVSSFALGQPSVFCDEPIDAEAWLELRARAEGANHVEPVGAEFWAHEPPGNMSAAKRRPR
jgi:hypothetical protein